MSATALETALREMGIRCVVEARERLAILIPDDAAASLDAARLRRDAVRLMRAHGFTNLALDIPQAPSEHAPLHRD